jgi:hypothetical protein
MTIFRSKSRSQQLRKSLLLLLFWTKSRVNSTCKRGWRRRRAETSRPDENDANVVALADGKRLSKRALFFVDCFVFSCGVEGNSLFNLGGLF